MGTVVDDEDVFQLDGPDTGWWFVSEWNDETQEGDELHGPYDSAEEAVAAKKCIDSIIFS